MKTDRRDFLLAAGALAAGACLGSRTAKAEAVAPGTFRTVTYNVHGFEGWPEKPTNQERRSAARPRMAERVALELALYAPDLITLCEAPPEDLVARTAEALGMHYVYFPGGYPGAILARGTIAEPANHSFQSDTLADNEPFSRHFGRALVASPLGDVAVYSVHLHPHNRDIRSREVAAVLAAMTPDVAAGRSILVQGDLNHRPDAPEYAQWQSGGLVDAFAAKGEGDGNTMTSVAARIRIDYIWLHGAVKDRLTACRALFEGAFRTNPDDPTSFALSDHVPVTAIFG